MHSAIAPHFYHYTTRLALCIAPLLASCSSIPTAPIVTPDSRLLAAFVVIGEDGVGWARTITAANLQAPQDVTCPDITLDGTTQRMTVRAPAATAEQRPTASDAASSKPSLFPVLTCEFRLPPDTLRASINNAPLPMPKAQPRRIVVIGDTGCRMKKTDNAWQACLDKDAWPFQTLADAAAAMAPDLVIHVGDYHYRENACPAVVAGCQGSPWGYGWDTWQADLFAPAAKLLAAAPWVVARGNHEECRRAGQGWFRFLDVFPFDQTRSCNEAKNDLIGDFTPPYSVPIANDLQLIVFDSAAAGNKPLDVTKRREAHAFSQYRQQFATVDTLANKPGVSSIFLNHHFILGYAPSDGPGVHGGNASLLSVMKTLHPQAYYPSSVRLALHGHVHLFEALNFSSNHPATIVSGIGGDQISANLPEPFPVHIPPAEGVTLESITHSNQFGFVVMDKLENTWEISAYDVQGTRKTTCVLTGSKIRCDRTGLLK